MTEISGPQNNYEGSGKQSSMYVTQSPCGCVAHW